MLRARPKVFAMPPKDSIHDRFKRFLVNNLCHVVDSNSKGDEVKLWEAYKQFSEHKWNAADTLLRDPTQSTAGNSGMFLRFVLLCEKENVPWFLVSRQVGLSDSNLQRCVNNFKQRYMYVTLPDNQRVDLGILEYLINLNKKQLLLRVPRSKPIMTAHTARLMRQLFLLHTKYPDLVPYRLDTDEEQFESILWNWFENNYTTNGEGIGYPRRQLLEEANSMITHVFGPNRLMYCHDPSWRALLRRIGIDDTKQKGSYLRLNVWKRASAGGVVVNQRRSCGPGGEFTFEKRKKQRLMNREQTSKEKDTARKQIENNRKSEAKNRL